MTRSATVLERAIAHGQRGDVSPDVALWTFAAGPAVILNDGDTPVSGFPDVPLVLERDGTSLLAAFTHQDMTGAYRQGRTPVAVPAFEVLRRLPPDIGLVINPGQRVGLEVPPQGVRAFTLALLDIGPERNGTVRE